MNDAMANETPPGVKNGIIVDASYWLWIDANRKETNH